MWISLIVTLITYFMSSKTGTSKGTSAAIAAAAGLGSYYLYDSGQLSSWFGSNSWTDPNYVPAAGVTGGANVSTTGNGLPTIRTSDTDPSFVNPTVTVKQSDGLISNIGSVLKSWGPAGTAAVVGTTAVVSGGATSLTTLLPWVLGGVALFMVLK